MDLITNLHVELQKVTEELEALERHVLEQEDELTAYQQKELLINEEITERKENVRLYESEISAKKKILFDSEKETRSLQIDRDCLDFSLDQLQTIMTLSYKDFVEYSSDRSLSINNLCNDAIANNFWVEKTSLIHEEIERNKTIMRMKYKLYKKNIGEEENLIRAMIKSKEKCSDEYSIRSNNIQADTNAEYSKQFDYDPSASKTSNFEVNERIGCNYSNNYKQHTDYYHSPEILAVETTVTRTVETMIQNYDEERSQRVQNDFVFPKSNNRESSNVPWFMEHKKRKLNNVDIVGYPPRFHSSYHDSHNEFNIYDN